MVLVFAVVLLVYSISAIAWYDTCTYIYMQGTGKTAQRECSSDDKSTGKLLYTVQIVFVVINAIATAAILVFVACLDKDLLRDCCSISRISYNVKNREKKVGLIF